jgi:hypothetical protein
MELASNLALAAGIIIEILLLWETSDRQKNVGIVTPGLSRLQEIIALTLLVSWSLIALAEFFKPALNLTLLGSLQSAIMLPLFMFLVVYGMVAPKLLPRINEQTIVVITAVIAITLVRRSDLTWYAWAALLLPLAGIVLLALTNRLLSPAMKSLFYFWYLICLFLMAYQSNFDLFFNAPTETQTTLDYFISGASGIFLLLHSIFLVRFFLMLSANILPKNRYLIRQTMPQLFSDEQMPRYKFIVILLLVVIVLWANRQIGFVSDLSFSNLLILFIVHFMDRSTHLTPKTV